MPPTAASDPGTTASTDPTGPGTVAGPGTTPAGPEPATDGAAPVDPDSRWAHRRAVVSAVVALVAVAAVLVVAAVVRNSTTAPDTGPLIVAQGLDQPGAGTAACTRAIAALPQTLDGRSRRVLTDPPPATVAWGDPALILRCGVPTPAELTCSAELVSVIVPDQPAAGATNWLEIDGPDDTTYLLADRQVRIAFTVPVGTPAPPLQQVAAAVQPVLPRRGVCDGEARLLPLDGGG